MDAFQTLNQEFVSFDLRWLNVVQMIVLLQQFITPTRVSTAEFVRCMMQQVQKHPMSVVIRQKERLIPIHLEESTNVMNFIVKLLLQTKSMNVSTWFIHQGINIPVLSIESRGSCQRIYFILIFVDIKKMKTYILPAMVFIVFYEITFIRLHIDICLITLIESWERNRKQYFIWKHLVNMSLNICRAIHIFLQNKLVVLSIVVVVIAIGQK